MKVPTPRKRDLAVRGILEAIRNMHQRNRTVASAYGSNLSIAETSVLIELRAAERLLAKDLVRVLRLSPVQVSRTLKRLSVGGFIKTSPCTDDSRKRWIVLSKSGQIRSDEVIEWGFRTFGSALLRLPAADRGKFERLQKVFCEGLNAPQAAGVSGDPKMMVEIRRLTRAFGFLGESAFASEFNPLEWHILSESAYSKGEVFIQDLASQHSISQATAAKAVQRLESRNYLSRAESNIDVRRKPIVATPQGLKALAQLESSVFSEFTRALSSLSDSELLYFSNLWKRYAGESMLANEIILSPTLQFHLVNSESERQAVRKFLMQERVAQDLLSEVPEQIGAKNSFLFSLNGRKGIVGVIEGQVSEAQKTLMITALVVNKSLKKPELRQFVLRTFSDMLTLSSKETLELDPRQVSAQARKLDFFAPTLDRRELENIPR